MIKNKGLMRIHRLKDILAKEVINILIKEKARSLLKKD